VVHVKGVRVAMTSRSVAVSNQNHYFIVVAGIRWIGRGFGFRKKVGGWDGRGFERVSICQSIDFN
jgi:hypothetical protein